MAPRLPAWAAGTAARAAAAAAAAAMIAALFIGGRQEFAVGLFPAPWDKLAHAAYFGALTALFWVAGGGRAALWPVLMAAGVGLADELHQSALPGREASLADFAVDAAAAATAGVLLRFGVGPPACPPDEPPPA